MVSKAKVVLCWHMHQPEYRDRLTGQYFLPWTYLHALKDYVDMLAHLEANPKACAVFNFAPILLEQLDDYVEQVDGYLAKEEPIKDATLAALVSNDLPAPSSKDFLTLASNCLRANEERIIHRFPAFHYLADTLKSLIENPDRPCYLNEQFLIDLLVWYHLGWMGEIVRYSDSRIQELQKKEGNYTFEDRTLLMNVIGEELRSLKPRYRKLLEAGRVELAMSPYAHPILPLLQDFDSAREAIPDCPLPSAPAYPGGKERARWHLQKGIEVFENYFGTRPPGCWASEGALSDASLDLLEEFGFAWTATGDSVLHNSLKDPRNPPVDRKNIHSIYQFAERKLKCFFRDDGLSDLIGFQYADWHAEDAVGDLLNHMVTIAESAEQPEDCVISVIMDGENAWEYYPQNAWFFLEALYRRLSEHPKLEMTTYTRLLSDRQPEPVEMENLVAGSWVYGSFSTWIGDADKNRAWDMLCEAKEVYDRVTAEKNLTEEERDQASEQLALCEGSDWFWWFGDYNPAQSVADFDFLYRLHLSNLYQLLNQSPPDYLSHSFSQGSGSPAAGGVMRRGHEEASSP